LQFVNCVLKIVDREIGDQLPADRCAPLGRGKFCGMDDLQFLVGIFLLFPDWWAHSHGSVLDLQRSALVCALRVAKPDLIGATWGDASHDPGNCCVSVFGEPINTAAHQEDCLGLVRPSRTGY